MVSLDSLDIARLDLIKIDVEGMEMEVLQGGRDLLCKLRPLMIVEAIKADRAALEALLLGMDYRIFPLGINLLAVHAADPTLQHISTSENGTHFALT